MSSRNIKITLTQHIIVINIFVAAIVGRFLDQKKCAELEVFFKIVLYSLRNELFYLNFIYLCWFIVAFCNSLQLF